MTCKKWCLEQNLICNFLLFVPENSFVKVHITRQIINLNDILDMHKH